MQHDENQSGQQSDGDGLTIAAKIYAIGELIKFRGGEPALDEERVNYGVGMILTDIANELRSVSTGIKD